MKKYILTLDEGTTSTRAIITDKDGKVISVGQHRFRQIYPHPSWVEHNASEIFSSQYESITDAIEKAGINPSEIISIGITNQRETTVVWDKTTGEPVYNAIVWQCRRTADYCEQLIKDGYEERIKQITGLKIDAYFSATKIKWILDNVEDARKRAENGELLFGTVDCWLLWKLSGGKVHATDYTNAARTMIFDIRKLCYDKDLLELFGIPDCMLPEVYPSGHNFGFADIMGEKIPVTAIIGDQQSALFGQRCFAPGDIKNTYGTGCFLLMNTGDRIMQSKNGLVSTLAATLDGEKPQYVLEGSVFIGGAVIEWLKEELKIVGSSIEAEELSKTVPDTGGVYIVPAFTGLGAPHWDMKARGSIFGLTRGSGRAQIARAANEAIAYQTDDLISAMSADSGLKVNTLKADGGASRNTFLMQFQSDISKINVICPENAEATAMGAAYLSGLCSGFWESRDALPPIGAAKSYSPEMDPDTQNTLKSGWKRAVRATKFYTGE